MVEQDTGEHGPTTPAMPAVPAQMPMAVARSGPLNTFARIDSVDGMINAAPTPMTARTAMSCDVVSQTTLSIDDAAKITRPICSVPLRPNRSLSEPHTNSRLPKTSA